MINDERGDIVTLLKENSLGNPADEICQGLVDHQNDIIFSQDILENLLNITQKYPKILHNIQQDLKVFSGFDEPALIKGRIITTSRILCKTSVQDAEIQTFTSEKECLTLEEL